MTVRLYTAPAAAGKTAFALERVRRVAQGLQTIPRVCLPTHLQVRAWRRRLARAEGAIGVRLLTFDRLYTECLSAAGEVYTELSEPVQYRLIRAIVDDLPLTHYAPLTRRPGFIQVLQRLFGELKAARIWPDAFARAAAEMGDEPRLSELASIYDAYQLQLQTHGWADRAGMAWLAVESLEERSPEVARDWPLLVVDGFDDFTPVQLALLKVLAKRVHEMIVLLTGTADGSERRFVHKRFSQTRQHLETALGVTATALPVPAPGHGPVLAHLERNLYRSGAPQIDAGEAIEFIEAADRAGEVRAAMRWLKARLMIDGARPGECALLARSIPPYRPFIRQITSEFGLPIRLVDGLPLRSNPAVVAILDLMRVMLPRDGETTPTLAHRLVVEAWRSPYFDWSALPAENAASPIGITTDDANALDAAARWGQVVGGHSQWEQTLTALTGRSQEADTDEERGLPVNIPVGSHAQHLLDKFRRFVRRLTPPPGQRRYRDFVGWLETLIGPDPMLASPHHRTVEEPTSLRVVDRARAATEAIAELDVAALQTLKDVLRGLVWAEEAIGSQQAVDFSTFFTDLVGAIEATHYHPPVHPEREEIIVADVVQARGVPFRAVALIGLAEGEFPAILSEDPFLRDTDRQRLRKDFCLALESSTESAEREFLYEAITRPRERLLLTRPRLTETGVPWQASPFWEELCRLVLVKPQSLTSESAAALDEVASWSELIESLVAHPESEALQAWLRQKAPSRQTALATAAQLLEQRAVQAGDSPFDGDLSGLVEEFSQRFGPEHTWSASRLENYRSCPFLFFVRNVLGLEPRGDPTEGLDARQLGSIYHRILEELYQDPLVADPSDLAQLLAALPVVAGRILDWAPQRQGFRETAWWAQTRREIEQNVRRSLIALDEMQGNFAPFAYEAIFGLEGKPPLVLHDGADRLRLRGIIDRVDRDAAGRVRIVDYKTSGPSAFTPRAIAEGQKLQLPLYALAARDALGLGKLAEGFYWHVRQAKPSGFTLSGYHGGAAAAMAAAAEKAWETARQARQGHFVPRPPDDGCPSYCPAVGFCWRYQRGYR